MDWNQRYDRPDFLFGTEPADFLAREAARLAPGAEVLCIADGEGRNSVHLAGLGHRVTAMDASPVALAKARKLAETRGVEVDFREADLMGWDWDARAFDAVIGIFFQFLTPPARAEVLAALPRAIRPGGLLMIHGYAPRQIEYGTGGPPYRENLYTLPLLHEAFPGFEVLSARDYDADVDEGEGHSGRSALIDFIARKPATAA